MDSEERPSKLRKLSHDGGQSHPEPDHHVTTTPQNGDLSHDSTLQPLHDAKPVDELNGNTVAEQAKDAETVVSADTSEKPPTSGSGKPLSKNQLKKLRKKQEWEAGKEWRKIKRKDKAKERKERKREQRIRDAKERKAKGLPSIQKPRFQRPTRLPITFVIDCAFDDKMSDKERISLGSQVTRAYSDNHRAPYQAHLMVSSWGGLLRERFDTVLDKQYLNWHGIQFTENDYVAAAEQAKELMDGPKGGKMDGVFRKYAIPKRRPTGGSSSATKDTHPSTNETSTAEQQSENSSSPAQDPQIDTVNPSPQPSLDPTSTESLPPPEVIYLTSDSPHTLTTLSPHSTYIIGGLVDKNRHKGICYRSAVAHGVKTAKLPIGEYMEMQSRFVLATNHVVEIMVRWLECGDWGEAFLKVIPKRKGGKLRKGGEGEEQGENENENEEGDEEGDNDEDDDGNGDVEQDQLREDSSEDSGSEDGRSEPAEQ